MILEILDIVAPVFLLALIGYVWRKRGLPFDVPFVSRLAMQVGVPALLFSVLSQMEIDPDAFRRLAGASLAFYAGVGVVSWGLIAASGLSRRAYLAPFIFGNTGNVGLPIALFAYGEAGLADAMVVFAVMAALSFTIGLWMVAGKGSFTEALTQPIFHAAILGLLFAWMGWEVPATLMRSLELTGQVAIPIMLMTLGVAVAQLNVRDVGRALTISVAKLGLCALAAASAAAVFELGPVATGVLVLQGIMPVAVTNYLLASRYNANPEAVAGLVVVSTLVSLAAIPAALAALL